MNKDYAVIWYLTHLSCWGQGSSINLKPLVSILYIIGSNKNKRSNPQYVPNGWLSIILSQFKRLLTFILQWK